MKLNRLTAIYFIALVALLSSCGGHLPIQIDLGSGQASTLSGSNVDMSIPTRASTTGAKPAQNPTTGQNVLTVTVNGASCGSSQYANEPCTSVTICQPGTSNCQTIDNILVDTGSFGLRIFSSVITVPLKPVTSTSGSQNIAECVQYGDGSSQWGQIQMADVQLAGEPTVTVPIQTINYSYATPPSPCVSPQSSPETSPSEAHFNGILGVGLLAQDCGSNCATEANNDMYYSCSGSQCTGTTVGMGSQVQNPVSLLPFDNNGVVVKLPTIAMGGTASVSGQLILGIETQANNTPSGVTSFTANIDGEFITQFGAATTPSFIDSGSSVLFIPPEDGLPGCDTAQGGTHGSSWEHLFCPSSTESLQATNFSSNQSNSAPVTFSLGNAFSLLTSNNMAFPDVAALSAADSTAFFDWGLPFFYGRTVYVGIDGFSSSIGTGTYWAY